MTEILIPATPLILNVALSLANTLAYGFVKHTNDGYWNDLFLKDPDYAWKRMLGWQAEHGPDEAKFGLYAVPPSAWGGVAPPVDPPAPPIEPGQPNPQAGDVILAAFKVLDGKLDAVLAAVKAVEAPTYEGQVAIPSWLGTGRVTLTPKK